MAALGQFALVDVKPFRADYRNVGYRGLSKSFNASKALLHEFSFSGHSPSPECLRANTQPRNSTIEPRKLHIRREVKFPLEYTVHFSFWVDESTQLVEQSLRRIISNHFPDFNVVIERQVDRFSKDGLASWCFELKLSCKCYALSRTDGVIRFAEALGERLKLEVPSAQPRL